MLNYSPELRQSCYSYLDLVDRGNLTYERSDAHWLMLMQFRSEGVAFRDRNEARDIARGMCADEFCIEWAIMMWHAQAAIV